MPFVAVFAEGNLLKVKGVLKRLRQVQIWMFSWLNDSVPVSVMCVGHSCKVSKRSQEVVIEVVLGLARVIAQINACTDSDN